MLNINLIVILVFVGLFIFSRFLPSKNKNNIFLILSCIFLFLILYFKEPYSDMQRYLKYFKYIDFNSNLRFEPIYVLYNIILRIFSTKYEFFLFVTSFIQIISLYIFIKRESKSYLISLIMFVITGLFHYDFYIVRQSISLAILLLSIKYIKENKLFKFLLCYIIMIGFHYSSIIYILFYILYNDKIRKHFLKLYPILLGIVILGGKFLINILINTRYSQYLNISNGGYGKLLFIIIILFFSIFLNVLSADHEEINEKEKNNMSYNFSLILVSLLFQILSLYSSLFVRVGNIFLIGSVGLLGNEVSRFSFQKDKILLTLLIIVFAIMYTFLIFNTDVYTLR